MHIDGNELLIVGAGPTGMVLGIELARRGIPYRMIDKRSGPSITSRSFTLHARTLEMFEQMGISDRFLKDGIRSRGFVFNFKGKEERPALDFTGLDSPFPYILVYNQNRTESRLRTHLDCAYDVRPQWSTELSELQVAEDGCRAVLSCADGRKEVIEPAWVVGCDGVHSFVRSVAGLDFAGANYEGMVMQMMDVAYKGFPGGDDWIHYYMSKENFLLVTKLPSGDHRVLISDMGEADDPNLSVRDAFQRLVEGHLQGSRLAEPRWATKWDIWRRIASDYRAGRAFLAGDAAHVHSPSGGQGMNVGMQDAYNLGWKLALVVQGLAKAELLDTYAPERRPVGEQVIAGTEAMHDIIMAHGHGMEDRLALTQAQGWHEQTVARISGLTYNYQNFVQLPAGLTVPDGPPPGSRAPDVALADGLRLFDLLRHPRLTLLIAPGREQNDQMAAELSRIVAERYDAVIKPLWASARSTPADEQDAVAFDANGGFAERYGGNETGRFLLIRPDGYIAYHGRLEERHRFLEYLGDWFVPTEAQP